METAKTTWAIDPMHSEIIFKVKHLVISTVTGKFEKFEGSVLTNGDDWNGAEVEFSADVNSINTGVGDRDSHLKSADFLTQKITRNLPTSQHLSKRQMMTNS